MPWFGAMIWIYSFQPLKIHALKIPLSQSLSLSLCIPIYTQQKNSTINELNKGINTNNSCSSALHPWLLALFWRQFFSAFFQCKQFLVKVVLIITIPICGGMITFQLILKDLKLIFWWISPLVSLSLSLSKTHYFPYASKILKIVFEYICVCRRWI